MQEHSNRKVGRDSACLRTVSVSTSPLFGPWVHLFCMLGALFASAVALSIPSQSDNLRIRVTGVPQVAVPAKSFNCGDETVPDLPDVPPTAYRHRSGQISFISGNRRGVIFRGPALDVLGRSGCGSINPSDGNSDPAAFRDQEWVGALFSFDGREVVAFVHHEYHGEMHGNECDIAPGRRECWYASTTILRSLDEGATFVAPSPRDSVLLAPSYKYRAGMQRVGTYLPKVVGGPRQKRVYVLVSRVDRNQKLRIGQCLLRSDRKMREWELWQPNGFVPVPLSPYFSGTENKTPEHCTPVVNGNILSVKWVPEYNIYVAIGAAGKLGVYSQTSRDLISWDRPQTISGIATDWAGRPAFVAGDEFPHRRWYFSLLDPGSDSRNFDTVSTRPFLYFVEFGDGVRRQALIRSIKRVQVVIERN